ncbi:TATA box-binding protein-associated factor RNA polymerase I subunit A [Trichomycterus rosablanca]|uniref:TATA box-binding protein-associated factor RNA polymerase I subunit A n=1 Tax=Trichomycterus rosablanca TaxID=2290929 RepID=UPI002F351E7B
MDDTESELNIPVEDWNEPTSEKEKSHSSIKSTSLLHVPPPERYSKENGFHISTRLSLNAIRDALLHHRWQEAAQYMSTYTETLEDSSIRKQLLACEIIWRLGTVILQHHPNSQFEDFNALYEHMKNAGVKNYSKICLEHAFYLLLNGHIEDAKQRLSVAASWRYGKQSAGQSLGLKLIHAYAGLLDYLTWSAKRSSVSEAEDSGTTTEMHSYFRQALVTLQEIIKQPGIWDPFVLSCIDMMEFYNDEEGALKLLESYAYDKDFPSNPNAHVYLYQHLKKHGAPPAKLIKTLKVLQYLVPSHELMLEYCSLLLNSENKEDQQEALSVVMNLLEYAGSKTDLNAWRCLLKILKCLKNKCHKDVIREEWAKRKDLWLALFYKNYHGKKDSKENVQLLHVKSEVIKVFGVYNRRYTYIHDLDEKKKSEKIMTKSRSKKKPAKR